MFPTPPTGRMSSNMLKVMTQSINSRSIVLVNNDETAQNGGLEVGCLNSTSLLSIIPLITFVASKVNQNCLQEKYPFTIFDIHDNTQHIEKLCNKLSSSLYMLKRVKYVFPRKVWRVLFNSYGQSHVYYGLSLWGPMCLKTYAKRVTIPYTKAEWSVTLLIMHLHDLYINYVMF